MDYINNGGTKVTEVSDRKLPTSMDPESKRSQEKGWTGKGLNEMTMPESMKEHLHQGVDTGE